MNEKIRFHKTDNGEDYVYELFDHDQWKEVARVYQNENGKWVYQEKLITLLDDSRTDYQPLGFDLEMDMLEDIKNFAEFDMEATMLDFAKDAIFYFNMFSNEFPKIKAEYEEE